MVNAFVTVEYLNGSKVNYVEIGYTDVYGQPGEAGGIVFSISTTNPPTLGIVLSRPQNGN